MKSTLLLAAALIGVSIWGHDIGGIRTETSKSKSYDNSLIYYKPKPQKLVRAKGFDF